MMNNFLKTRDWLKLTLGDLDTAIRARKEKDYPDAVFHLQQCLEKSCKAILSFLGIEVKKTHFPAGEIIRNKILNNPEEINRLALKLEHIQLLKDLVANTILLEDERTIPRYGREWKGRVILPGEIYDKKRTNTLFKTARNALQNLYTFLKKFSVRELKEVLKDVEIKTEELREDK